MPERPPDNVQRGVLAEAIRARATRPKITDPEEVIDLPPGANTVRRRTRY